VAIGIRAAQRQLLNGVAQHGPSLERTGQWRCRPVRGRLGEERPGHRYAPFVLLVQKGLQGRAAALKVRVLLTSVGESRQLLLFISIHSLLPFVFFTTERLATCQNENFSSGTSTFRTISPLPRRCRMSKWRLSRAIMFSPLFQRHRTT